jgi:cyanophycin synthetase
LELGSIASRIFDELFFREDPSTRGRPRGEVMNLLRDGAIQGGAAMDRVHLVAGEAAATAAALYAAQQGDLIVVTPTDVEGSWEQIVSFEKIKSATAGRTGHLAAAE